MVKFIVIILVVLVVCGLVVVVLECFWVSEELHLVVG